jgi:hypothetical protein
LVIFAVAFCGVLFQLLVTDSAMAQSSLFDQIGVGTNWGPHWATGTTPAQDDVRDAQDDGAFPAEICLVANAGFKTIRLYGENMETWIATLDAVDDYNKGKLNCTPPAAAQPCNNTTKPCMSVVYQTGICGPDPRSLTWNGLFLHDDIESVACYGTGGSTGTFAQSVREETAKLKQVLRYAGDKFANLVPLVIVGNEILYSRGLCSDTKQPCTEDSNCGGTCIIQHFCSTELSSTTQPAQCTNSKSCKTGTCTDVTNFRAIEYAFLQVQATLKNSLPAGAKEPKLTISLQADVLTSPSFGDDPKTASLMYSRQLFKSKLAAVGNVLAVNVYPDQWGMILKKSGHSYPSCINETNAVLGKLLPSACASSPDPSIFRDSRTGLVAHSIANYLQVLRSKPYYQGMDILISETGWHTDGICSGYNDPTSTYSPKQAAAFYSDLYKYLQSNQTPVLVFELFDQKTKSCVATPPKAADEAYDIISAGLPPAEANYGIFDNYCRLKGDRSLYSSFLPPKGHGSPGPNLDVFQAMLDDDGHGGKSCGNQTLIKVIGDGDNGACYYNPQLACHSGYPEGGTNKDYVCPPGPADRKGIPQENPCMWGICTNGKRGCNPNDPDNAKDGCTCVRSGICANTSPNAGIYYAVRKSKALGIHWNAACVQDSSCDDAIAPFTNPDATCKAAGNRCGCFAELAPSTVFRTITENIPVEGPGFKLNYQTHDGVFRFSKTRTISQRISEEGNISSVWGEIFMGKNWKLQVTAPQGSQINGSPAENTIKSVIPGPSKPTPEKPQTYSVTWSSPWSNYKYAGSPVNPTYPGQTDINFPRGFLTVIPTAPLKQPNLIPHRPEGWTDKLVITKEGGRFLHQDTFNTTDSLYAHWAIINDDEAPTATTFHCALLVDGVVNVTWKRSAPLNPGGVIKKTDVPLGQLPAGVHRIRIVADSTGVVQESNESDNHHTRTITVRGR